MGNLFPVSDRKNSIHRCFRAAAAEEALTNILRIRAVRRCLQNGVGRGADGGGVGFFELEARAKFGDTGGDAALFVRLREENERLSLALFMPQWERKTSAFCSTAI